jgi:serine/threonine-protein kinase RsbW
VDDDEPMPERLLEETAEELYEHAPCGYLTMRPDGRILRVNLTFVEWTGHGRDELLEGRRFQDLLTAGGRLYHETHLSPLLHMQDAVSEIALEITCADGRRLPVLVNSTLKRDEQGAPVLIRTTVFNATDRQKYERELLHSRRAERSAREGVERLQRVTAGLSAALDAPQIGRLLLAELARAIEIKAAVFASAADDGALRIVATHGTGHPGAPWLAEESARAERPVYVEGEGPASALLPMHVGERLAGVVWLELLGDTALRPDERTLLEASAGQCALALERARLQEATSTAAGRAAFLADLGRLLDQAAGLRDRGERLVDHLVDRLVDGAWARIKGVDDGDEPVDIRRGEVPGSALAAMERVAEGADKEHVDGAVVLPLCARNRSLGALVLAGTLDGCEVAQIEPAFLDEVADRAAVALENARLSEHDRTVAHALQRSLLAAVPPADPRCEIATYYQAGVRTLEVGGDWHDSFEVADGVIGIVVGDVVGRGLGAASAMGQLRSALRALAGTRIGPARVLEALDRFVEQVEAAQMATVVYMEVDLASGAVRHAAAGHPPPILIPRSGDPRLQWGGRSAPLGTYIVTTPRPEAEITLSPGDRLLLYTDGVVERREEPIDAGLDRLVGAIDASAHLTGPGLIDGVTGAMLVGEPDDDACLLCFHLAPSG